MAKERFDHEAIEKAVQQKWAQANLYVTDLAGSGRKPTYLLFEFPYPSGDLHIGHWYAFALTDIYARFKRMQGDAVLFPIGFDAFGLPAENAAMKYGKNPKEWTYSNMETMRAQIQSMGTSVDWSKEVVTCDPGYYKWTQWLFGKFFEQGLAERKEAPVKWCPTDKTVLANEQVVDGACERCGTPVEERNLTQWFFKITEYAERLLVDLEDLPWPEAIKESQRAWIGKSEGAKITFPLIGRDEVIEVFTTRPDTLFGVTYVVLAPEHRLTETLLASVTNAEEVRAYIKAAKKKTERERSENKEKTGVRLDGVKAVNPATKEEIPVFVADYALSTYGTGAVMAVPAHDERDFGFAKKHGLPSRSIIEGKSENERYTGDGVLQESGVFTGHRNRDVMGEMVASVGGEKTTHYRIRDWLISRQRYWGCPIPVVYDPEGKPHLIPEEHLPWLLPEDVSFASGESSPLASSKELKERVTRIFGEGWTPEYDTLDTFVDSSWYFLRYLDPKDEHNFSDYELMKKWMPVQRYSGGSEHTTMHLLYARFFTKALYDLALCPVSEPFTERYNRGLILGPDGQKMSKSKGNVVNPDEFVKRYGADAVRSYLAFIGPYNEPGHYPWNLEGVESMRRFLDRIFRLKEKLEVVEPTEAVLRATAKTNVKVATDIERFKFNTALSALMVLMNLLEELPVVPQKTYHELLMLLAPFAPHLAQQLWSETGGEGLLAAQAWPQALSDYLHEDTVTVVVQVKGKKRGEVILAADASEEMARDAALSLEALSGVKVGKVIYVPGRIINIVPLEG